MDPVDHLFNPNPYQSYPHHQAHLYNFYPQQQQPPTHQSRQPSPHQSPASTPITPSPHGLFLQQQQHPQQPQHPQPESQAREQRDPEPPIDQIQDDVPLDEEPLYVNAKQYYRILKRRVARARLEELHRLSRQRKPYLHESRHKHAMRRPRGPGGRFLTAEEIAAQKASQAVDPGPSASTSQDGEDDDAELGDKDIDKDIDKDVDMSVDSPLDTKPSFGPSQVKLPDNRPDQRSVAASQPTLQPRPLSQSAQAPVQVSTQTLQMQPPSQVQTQPQLQSQTVQSPTHMQASSHFQGQSQSQPQSQTHQSMHAPFDSPLSLGHSTGSINLMNVGYHPALSHPATPAPLSPHSSMSDALQNRDHLGHGHFHQERGQHDHSRHIASSSSSSGIGSHMSQNPPQPGAPTASTASSSMNSRAPYLQMHHVPHPHAHARHHHSYVNNVERLYPDDHNVIGISSSLKGDIQSRPGGMMQYGSGADPSRR